MAARRKLFFHRRRGGFNPHDYPHLFILNNQLVMIGLARRQQS